MSERLVSVIIPVYNVEEYLKECLESVVNQTYKNIEIITINDGSTDNSLNILKSYASKYKNIKIISQKNSGQSVARNVGINKANGKYIFFLDSDDYIMLNTLEELIKIMEKYNLDIIRFGAEPFFDKYSKKIDSMQYDFSMYFETNKIYTKNELLKVNTRSFWPSPVLYVFRKDILVKNHITFKPGIMHEDILFTTELFLNCRSGMYNPNLYYKRRFRPNSVMTSTSLQSKIKSFESRYVILNELKNLLKKYNNKYEKKLIKKRINTVLTALIYNYDDLDKDFRIKKLKRCKTNFTYNYYYCIFRKNILSLLKKLYIKL